jgi:hypothetical protein
LQRDPIGILGGLNVYNYVRSRPTSLIDPAGLIDLGGGGDSHIYPVPGYHNRQSTPPKPPSPFQSVQDMKNARRNENIFRYGIKGAAATCALFAGGPIGIGVGLGLILFEVYEQIQNEVDAAQL